ncbi:uncharacterized protein METZ01_LOCUS438196, partial [marine metagenome]
AYIPTAIRSFKRRTRMRSASPSFTFQIPRFGRRSVMSPDCGFSNIMIVELSPLGRRRLSRRQPGA